MLIYTSGSDGRAETALQRHLSSCSVINCGAQGHGTRLRTSVWIDPSQPVHFAKVAFLLTGKSLHWSKFRLSHELKFITFASSCSSFCCVKLSRTSQFLDWLSASLFFDFDIVHLSFDFSSKLLSDPLRMGIAEHSHDRISYKHPLMAWGTGYGKEPFGRRRYWHLPSASILTRFHATFLSGPVPLPRDSTQNGATLAVRLTASSP